MSQREELFNSMRIKELMKIMKEQVKSNDSLQYIKLTIIKFMGQKTLDYLKTMLKTEEEMETLLRNLQLLEVKGLDNLEELDFKPIIMILQGEFKISENSNNSYKEGDIIDAILMNQNKSKEVQIKNVSSNQAYVLVLDPKFLPNYTQISETQQNLDIKFNTLRREIHRFKNIDDLLFYQLQKYFVIQNLTKGQVITIPNSGTNDLCILIKGQVIIFIEKENHIYAIASLQDSGLFNEANCLLDHHQIYGSVVLSDQAQILRLQKVDLNSTLDKESLDFLRANYQSKHRLYQNMSQKIGNDSKVQIQLFRKFDITEEEFNQIMEGSKIKDKVQTYDQKQQIERNIKSFNDKYSQGYKNIKTNRFMLLQELLQAEIGISFIISMLNMTSEQAAAFLKLQVLGKNTNIKSTNLATIPTLELQKTKEMLKNTELRDINNKKQIQKASLNPINNSEKEKPKSESINQKFNKTSEELLKSYNDKKQEIKLEEVPPDPKIVAIDQPAVIIRKPENIPIKPQTGIDMKRKKLMSLGI